MARVLVLQHKSINSVFKNQPLFVFNGELQKYVSPNIHWSKLCSQAKSQFKRRSTANNVEIVIPVPADADSPKFKTTVGSCKYAPELNSVIWTIKSFPVSMKI